MSFNSIALIYNPNSTNDAKEKAEDFLAQLKEHDLTAELFPTDHAGHAEEIAYNIAARYSRPLIVSVSGDGGYHEVINGIMHAKREGKAGQPTVAIIAAGNANDHKRTTRQTPLIDLVIACDPKPLDLLHLQAGELDLYAHSYIGLGITPAVGIELNKHDLNPFVELQIIIKSFRDFTPFRITVDGKTRGFSSLVFANIDSMAKVLKLDSDSSIRDGKFEVVAIHNHGKLHLLLALIRSIFIPHGRTRTVSRYDFTTTTPVAIQLDGEIKKVGQQTDVKITSHKHAVHSLY